MARTAFETQIERLSPSGVRALIQRDRAPLRYSEVLTLWQEANPSFLAVFLQLLQGVEWPAYRWETLPVSAATVGRPFEFVLLNAPWLELPADPSAFAEHLRTADGTGVATFANLGGDAVLVAPVERGARSAYGHLAAFSRRAPREQFDALWQAVGCAMMERLGSRPVWLSTAGGGVPWLHVRLDDRPKYYGHRPYADDRG